MQYELGQFVRQQDAEKALEIAKGQKAMGVFVPPAKLKQQRKQQQQAEEAQAVKDTRTVDELFTSWLEWLKESRGLSESTVYTYSSRITANFLPVFTGRTVASITSDEIKDWYQELRRKKKDSNAHEAYVTVGRMFKYASGEAQGLSRSFEPWVDQSPVDVITVGKDRKRRRDMKQDQVVATEDEIRGIAERMPPDQKLAVLLGCYCALRLGEVLGLQRGDIELSKDEGDIKGELSVRRQFSTKGGAKLSSPKSSAGYRQLPISSKILKDVIEHLNTHVDEPNEAFLFCRPGDLNYPYHSNTLREYFNKARDKYIYDHLEELGPNRVKQLRGLMFHGLRHTGLTMLGRAGASNSDLLAFGGHSDIETVLVYQHSDKKRLDSLVNPG
ncbi:tyrosine-type recombinase/integrase [Auritidibacter ignavus]|uniref:tyrosine-type recombinase/integrase n=1 Tax=Auritidibacter ignavus TaxID=678932 RepID=UPI0024B9ED38|nr:site-specific integrase [Auritidibacter ignavus]WHS35214.1 tyrosine-type recombinase/integrase [Auritidibacter ignavus]